MVHCPDCGTNPVEFTDLPVELPDLENIRVISDEGHSPLDNAKPSWLFAECPKCKSKQAKRETQTMDTFFDSSWYYLRYLDPNNAEEPFSATISKHPCTPLPVNLYIGGKEHAIMHLYYARFISHFLYNQDVLKQREPFKDLLTQGMVMGESYRSRDSGRYLKSDEVEEVVDDKGQKFVAEKLNGTKVHSQWEKMSKSKFNGVDPKDVLNEFGCDATRICILSGVAPKSDRKWSNQEFHGVTRWQNRIWSLVTEYRLVKEAESIGKGAESSGKGAESSGKGAESSNEGTESSSKGADMDKIESEIFEFRNLFLKDINFHMEKSYLISTAISRLHGLTNSLMKVPAAGRSSFQYERALGELIVMVSTMAPHFAAELWSGFTLPNNNIDWAVDVFDQMWPKVDQDYCMNLKVLLNDRPTFEVKLPMTIWNTSSLLSEQLAISTAESSPEYSKFFSSRALNENKLGSINSVKLNTQQGVRADLHYETTMGKKRKKRHHKFLAKTSKNN